MSTDITPADSACPIFFVPDDAKQLAKDQAADKAADQAAKDKTAARQIILDRLGITADEVELLLG
jgi:hypothetical protein